MGWLGAMAGAFLGSHFGGILGGLIGAVFGNALETKLRGTAAARSPQEALRGRNELITLAALSAMLAKMAKADGVVTADEVAYCEKVFRYFGLTGEKRAWCVKIFREAKNDSHSIYEYAADFAAQQSDTVVREIVYACLWDLACIDGRMDPREHEYLQKLVVYLGLNAFAYRQQAYIHHFRPNGPAAESAPSAPDPYEVLGVASTASDDEVKAAYRALAKKLHPDVLRASGLSEEMLGKATERMAQVNAAWAAVKRARGL